MTVLSHSDRPDAHRFVQIPADDQHRKTAEDREQDQRWQTWREKAARADAGTQRRVKWLAAALFGSSGLWLAFEIMRWSPLAP
jgi:hypothetical protein